MKKKIQLHVAYLPSLNRTYLQYHWLVNNEAGKATWTILE
jgi:hypothetical protein